MEAITWAGTGESALLLINDLITFMLGRNISNPRSETKIATTNRYFEIK